MFSFIYKTSLVCILQLFQGYVSILLLQLSYTFVPKRGWERTNYILGKFIYLLLSWCCTCHQPYLSSQGCSIAQQYFILLYITPGTTYKSLTCQLQYLLSNTSCLISTISISLYSCYAYIVETFQQCIYFGICCRTCEWRLYWSGERFCSCYSRMHLH